jgi:hypothetical protein
MKIRTGFVSNSSSSSFCLLGVKWAQNNDDDIDDILRENNSFLSFARGIETYADEYIIGIDPDSIKNDQTLFDVKKDICLELDRIFGENVYNVEDISFYTDGGYDG